MGYDDAARAQARTLYQAAQTAGTAQTARGQFKNEPGKLAQLGLGGDAPDDEAGFLQSARTLFSVARRYDAKRLQARAALVDAFAQSRTQQTGASGDAQQASRDEDTAFVARRAWTGEFIPNAKQALKAKPEPLEKMGIPAHSPFASRRKPAD